MLVHMALLLLYAVAPDSNTTSNITMSVQSTSAEGTWSCLLDLWIGVQVSHDGNKVTVTVHEPHARMEAAASAPEKFRATIASESPSQQRAIAVLDGQSVSFTVDRKTGALVGAAPRFKAEVSFAGVDAAYWFALVWLGAGRVTPTHQTAWGVPWKLSGELSAGLYLAASGTLEGDLVAGGIKRHVKIAIAPRR